MIKLYRWKAIIPCIHSPLFSTRPSPIPPGPFNAPLPINSRIVEEKWSARIDKFFALPYFLRDAGIPVLDTDNDPISVVVSGVADVEWSAYQKGQAVNWYAIFSIMSSSEWSAM